MTGDFFFVSKRMKAPVFWIKCASLRKLFTGPLNLWISVQPPRMICLWKPTCNCCQDYNNDQKFGWYEQTKTGPRNNSWENNEGELTARGCFITTWDHQYTLKGFSSLLERSGAVMDVFQPQRGGSVLTDVDGLPLCFRGLGCLCECWHNTGSSDTRLAPPYVHKYIHKYIHIYWCTHTHRHMHR